MAFFTLANTFASFTQIDTATGTRQIEAGNDLLYVLKDNGNIWTYNGSGFTKIDTGTGTKQLEAAPGVLYILKDSGNIWSYDGSKFSKIDPGTKTKQLEASKNSELFILKDSGNIWSYDNTDSTGSKSVEKKILESEKDVTQTSME